jgi:hypothetical protein
MSAIQHSSGDELHEQIKVKVKCKNKVVRFLTQHHAMKAYWGSEGIAPRIL